MKVYKKREAFHQNIFGEFFRENSDVLSSYTKSWNSAREKDKPQIVPT